MDVFKLLGRIALDNSDAMSGMDDTVSKAKDTESKLTKIFNKIGTVVATAFATDKIISFGNACKDAYAEVSAEQSAFGQIMGEYAGKAQKKLEGVADSTGTVSTRMTTHMTSLTAKFKGLGFGVEDATDMAASGLKMAADAAAFWDMSLDESTGHLNSFINGSYEGGEAIGLFANDTQMAMFAVKSGLIATTKEWSNLDEATKQATRLEYAQNVLAMSGATGQAAKEAGSLANVQANLTENWRQFKAVIGEPIVNNLVIPAMQKLNELMPQITEATKTGIEWISTAFGSVKEAVKNLPETLTSAGTAISDTWTKTVYPAIQNAFKIVFGIELPEWDDLKASVVNWWESDNGIKRGIASVCNWVLNLFGAPANVTSEDVSRVLSGWWTSAKTAVQNACSWVLNLFGAPEETPGEAAGPVTTWWKNTREEIEKSCPWVLRLFGIPEETPADAAATLATWWNGAKTAIENACEWALKLFGAPEDLTVDKAKAILSDWWTTAKTHVANACEWALKLFGAPEDLTVDKAQTILAEWWTTAKTHVANACEWALKLFKEPKVPTADEVKAILASWWASAKGFVQSACEWALNPFGEPGTVTQLDVEKILQPWWLKAVGLVKNVCTWALDWFGAPAELTNTDAENILDTWWGKAITLVQDTCSWVLALFGAPAELTANDVEGIIGTWWDSAITLVEDACAWVLNLFGEPEPLTAERVESILGVWWTSAKALVQNACDWVLQLFTNPNESQQTIIAHINSWWESAGNIVAGACSWVLQLFGVPAETTDTIKQIVQEWWDGVKNGLATICGLFFSILGGDPIAAKTLVKNWWESFKQMCASFLSLIFGIEPPDVSKIVSDLKKWWDNVLESLGLLKVEAQATVHYSSDGTLHGGGGRSFDTGDTGSSGESSGGFWSAVGSLFGFGSNYVGFDYVPYDNYPSLLHKGEAVLTRTEAEAWRSGYGDTRRMEAILSNVENILQVVAQNTGASKQIVLDSGALVGQLAPGMDAQLGTISNRKGRRN